MQSDTIVHAAVVVAICTYNRAASLPALVHALRAQHAPQPFDIFFVNNNSSDDTLSVLAKLADEPGASLRYVTETTQGIVPARNRVLSECVRLYEYILVMDDDEIPRPGWVVASLDALINEDAECVGGAVEVAFREASRPSWLGDELLGFLAQVDYGKEPFWVRDDSTPIWTANVGYRAQLFREGLCFDRRYNREGNAVGGGEDLELFRALVATGARVRYRPDMVVEHHVEAWRLTRRYFLRLHYASGRKAGLYETRAFGKTIFGIPRFMLAQLLRQLGRALTLAGRPGSLRQAMNVSHALGMIVGLRSRRRVLAQSAGI